MEFLMSCLDFGPGYRLYNYADKPDLTTNELVCIARETLGKNSDQKLRVPIQLSSVCSSPDRP
ncbi:MAG: hypothetical protein KAV87_08190, partial [Desulfobacteraceae bacterium]|nr:hypothetical protein [Desulfobacteraceae bacterium]